MSVSTEENYKRAVALTEGGMDCDMKVSASWLRLLIEDYRLTEQILWEIQESE